MPQRKTGFLPHIHIVILISFQIKCTFNYTNKINILPEIPPTSKEARYLLGFILYTEGI